MKRMFSASVDGCKYEVMIAANVGTCETPCVCFVDTGLQALGCQDEVYLLVNLPLGAYQVAVLDILCGWRVLAMVNRLPFANSMSLHLLSLSIQCQIFLLSLPSVWFAPGPILAIQLL